MITNKPSQNKKKKGNKSVSYSFLALLFIAIVLISYYLIVNREAKPAEEVKATKVQEVLLRDLEHDYPPTPKEVIVYFSELQKSLLNDTYTEEEKVALFQKIKELFDQELKDNMTEQDYLLGMETELLQKKADNITMSSFKTSISTDVVYFNESGFECAGLYGFYTLRSGTGYYTTKQVFILRKDSNSHWKIFGWMLDDELDANKG